MARCNEIIASEEVINSFKNCNMERLYKTIIEIAERRYGVKITYEFRKKTPEELAAEQEQNKPVCTNNI
jgi:hypothetical protein